MLGQGNTPPLFQPLTFSFFLSSLSASKKYLRRTRFTFRAERKIGRITTKSPRKNRGVTRKKSVGLFRGMNELKNRRNNAPRTIDTRTDNIHTFNTRRLRLSSGWRLQINADAIKGLNSSGPNLPRSAAENCTYPRPHPFMPNRH